MRDVIHSTVLVRTVIDDGQSTLVGNGMAAAVCNLMSVQIDRYVLSFSNNNVLEHIFLQDNLTGFGGIYRFL